MKIIGMDPFPLWLPEVDERCDRSRETLLVRVHTDAGISGVGESALVAKAIVEALCHTSFAAVSHRGSERR